MGKINHKVLLGTFMFWVFWGCELFSHHKPGHSGGGGNGNGNGNVPEIDGNEVFLLFTLLVFIYLIFFYSKKRSSSTI